MGAPFVVIRRHPYEEPHLLNVEVHASNGTFSGATDFYSDPQAVGKLGRRLQQFPTRVPDELVYEYGYGNPGDRFYRLFRLRAYTTDGAGHCALQFAMTLEEAEPHEGVCRFSIPTDAAALTRLGDLLVRFAELRHLELRWGPGLESGELFEDYQR